MLLEHIEREVRQGFATPEEANTRYELTPEETLHLQQVYESGLCVHPREKLRVIVIVEECSECGRIFQHQIVTPDQRLQSAIVQAHQGLIDAEAVISAGDYTEEEQTILRAAWEGKCEHEQIEPYECSCSQKTRWRCKACARVWDHKPRKRM